MERSRRVQPLPDWGLLASANGVWEAEPGPGKKKEGGRGKAREAEPQDALRQLGDRNPSRTCFYPPHINLLPTWQACSEQSKRVPWHVGQLESSPPLSSPPLPCDDSTLSCYDGESVIPGISYVLDSTAPAPPTPPVDSPTESLQKRLSLDSSGLRHGSWSVSADTVVW